MACSESEPDCRVLFNNYVNLVRPAGLPAWATWLGLGLLVVVWVATFLLAVPSHYRLHTAVGSARSAAIAGLVATNWLRTVAWSGRSLLLLYGVFRLILAA